MSKTAIYPGTFDPVTNGHIDVLKRAVRIFDNIIVAVAEDTQKKTLFSVNERVALFRESIKDMPEISVEPFSGLVVDFARQKKTNILLRGLRMISDFEYEFQMALTNRRLTDEVQTVFLMPSEKYSFTSSTLLKEVAALGGDMSSFVPALVEKKLKEKLNKTANSG